MKSRIPWNKGKKFPNYHTESTKKRISESMSGINNPFYGKKHTEETKERIRKARAKQKPISEEGRKKLSLANTGKKRTVETRKKMSNSRKGMIFTDKHKKNLSLARKGRFNGKESPNWRGGISRLPYAVDWTDTLKRSIRERDQYKCQMPGCNRIQTDETFSVHHIDYVKNNCNPDNLITLCHRCHSKTNFNRQKWIKYFNNLIKQIC